MSTPLRQQTLDIRGEEARANYTIIFLYDSAYGHALYGMHTSRAVRTTVAVPCVMVIISFHMNNDVQHHWSPLLLVRCLFHWLQAFQFRFWYPKAYKACWAGTSWQIQVLYIVVEAFRRRSSDCAGIRSVLSPLSTPPPPEQTLPSHFLQRQCPAAKSPNCPSCKGDTVFDWLDTSAQNPGDNSLTVWCCK